MDVSYNKSQYCCEAEKIHGCKPVELHGDEIANDPESDDDTDEMYKRFAGHKPKKGETIADEVEESEKARKESEV